MFEHFTVGARQVVMYAQNEARELGHPHIGTEHLLLGLLHDEADPTGQAMRAAGITRATARLQLTELVGATPAGPAHGHIPFTDRAKHVLEHAVRMARRQSHIGRPHLLAGLLDVRDGTAVRVLAALQVDVDGLAATARDLAAHDVAPTDENGVTTATVQLQRRKSAWWRRG